MPKLMQDELTKIRKKKEKKKKTRLHHQTKEKHLSSEIVSKCTPSNYCWNLFLIGFKDDINKESSNQATITFHKILDHNKA